MAKTLIQSVVKQLQQERARLENELHRVTAALTTFGKVFLQGSKRRARRNSQETNDFRRGTQENCSRAESAMGQG